MRLSGATTGPWADRWRPMLGFRERGGVRPPEPGPVPTGDVGTVDGEGWLTVLDRKKLVIIRGGANVYPLEVERVIATHPDVAAVAVCAVPDDRLGQRVAAVVRSAGPRSTSRRSPRTAGASSPRTRFRRSGPRSTRCR